MRKVVGWPLAWALYYLGDLVSRPTNWGKWDGKWQNWYGSHTNWLYSWALCRSSNVQDWAFPEAEDSKWFRWWPWRKLEGEM